MRAEPAALPYPSLPRAARESGGVCLLSLPPCLSPPSSSPAAVSSFSRTPPPGIHCFYYFILFYLFIFFGAGHSLAVPRVYECWRSGLGRGAADCRPLRDPRKGGRLARRAICSLELTLQTPVECVRAGPGGGSVRRALGGLPLDGVLGLGSGQLQAHKLLNN